MAFPSDINVTAAGQINLAGDDLALFLREFSGQVLEVFRNDTVVLDRHSMRTIRGAKAHQFPGIGVATGGYHTRGNSILDSANGHMNQIRLGEVLVTVDRPLLNAVSIDELEEVINHYDQRAPFAEALGKWHAEKVDTHLFQTLIKASQDTGALKPTSDHPDATVLTDASYNTASGLITAAKAAAQAFDEANVPKDRRYMALKPQEYYTLIDNAAGLIDTDVTAMTNGGLDTGEVKKLMGFELLESNLVPQTDLSAAETGVQGQNYQVNAENTTAVCWHPMSIGSVQAMGMTTSVEWSVEYQSWVLIAKQAIGHGVLRPEAAIQIRTAAP